MSWSLVFLALLGCPKDPKPAEGHLTFDNPQQAVLDDLRVVGPTRWVSDDGAVCLDVPAGWSGWRGGGDALLALDHPTGVGISLMRGPSPASRRGFVRMFENQGSYRDVPLLVPSATLTWISELPGGPTIQEWVGQLDGTTWRVEVRYPSGSVVRGRQVADELLSAFCRP